MRDVGDVHPHFPVAVFKRLQAQRVVEVLGVNWIDGHGQHLAKVASTGHLVRIETMGIVWIARRKRLGRGLHLWWKLIRQAKLRQNRVHFHLVLPLLAEDLHDPAHWLVPGVVPLFQRQEHLVPFRGATEVASGDEKVSVDALVGGFAEPVVAHQGHGHDVVLAQPLGDALDTGRGATASLPPLNFHRVAPKRVSRLSFRHADLVAVRHAHETGAHAGNLDGAFCARLFLDIQGGQHVPPPAQFLNLSLLRQFLHQRHHRTAHVVVENAECTRHLFVIQGLARALPKHAQDRLAEVRWRAVIGSAVLTPLALPAPVGIAPHKLVGARAATSFSAHASKMRLVAELAAR